MSLKNFERISLNNIDNQGNEEVQWYLIRCFSGFEQSVVDRIKDKAEMAGIITDFVEFYVPSFISKVLTKSGKKEVKKAIYPGYFLIKMHLTEQAQDLVSKTDRVISFGGPRRGRPSVIPQEEYESMVKHEESFSRIQNDAAESFEVGQRISVCDGGSLNDFEGKIESVDEVKRILKVSVRIFDDRVAFMELGWDQVKKVAVSDSDR